MSNDKSLQFWGVRYPNNFFTGTLSSWCQNFGYWTTAIRWWLTKIIKFFKIGLADLVWCLDNVSWKCSSVWEICHIFLEEKWSWNLFLTKVRKLSMKSFLYWSAQMSYTRDCLFSGLALPTCGHAYITNVKTPSFQITRRYDVKKLIRKGHCHCRRGQCFFDMHSK